MARKTPDYTKQARRPSQARPARSKEQQDLAPPSRLLVFTCYMSLIGAAGIFVWGCALTYPSLGQSGMDGRVAIISSIGMTAGVVTNILVLIMAMYAFDPKRHAFPRLDKRILAYGIIFIGLVAVVVVMSSNVGQAIFGPALIPAVAVYYFVVRARLKAIAIAEGRYVKSRRDQALEESRAAYEEKRRQKDIIRRRKAAQTDAQAGTRPSSTGSKGAVKSRSNEADGNGRPGRRAAGNSKAAGASSGRVATTSTRRGGASRSGGGKRS